MKEIFSDLNQYMKNGILLRQVVNVIDEIDFSDVEDRHTFGDIYEGILKDLQSAGNAGAVSYTHLDVYKRQLLNY